MERNRIYGYLRVSSDEQDVNSQKQGVDKFAEARGWEIDEYITDEGVSGGMDPDKRNLGPMLRKLRKGDIVIASEISRLGRDLYMVMDILHFCMKTECKIYTVKDNFALDDNIQSKVLAFAFGLAAEIERQMIRQRTREGLKLRMKMGVLVGRPIGRESSTGHPVISPHKEEILRSLEWGASLHGIADSLKVDRNTLARYVKRWKGKLSKTDAKALERARKERERNRILRGVDYQVVELPRQEVRDMILQDLTIPEMHLQMPQYTYEQLYDSILCDPEFNPLYREHGQLRAKKKRK